MDDIFREIDEKQCENKLAEINNYHSSLAFTAEKEEGGELPFLDCKLINHDGCLSSTWYCKPTDTGLIMNFHALAPMKYKRACVTGFVYRVYRACSSWENFHESIKKTKTILLKNQYPPRFTERIIHDTLEKIIVCAIKQKEDLSDNPYILRIQYRGKCTEKYARDLRKTGVPLRVVYTLRKLKTVTPSLKEPVDMSLRSGIVYKLSCPRCNACYVGATSRHLQVRFKEHVGKKTSAVSRHLKICGARGEEMDMEVLGSTLRGEWHLFALEALWIRELKPTINVKDEFRSRELIIKF